MTRTTEPRTGETKAALVRKLLSRKAGAELAALQDATGWQAHSVRAALSTLRKAGYTIDRMPPKSHGGASAYRISAEPAGA